MEYFRYQQNQLWAENIPLQQVINEVGTPCYIYSQQAIVDAWTRFEQAFQTHPHQICYAVKANSNLAVLNTLAQLGSGFDIVSSGELARVIAAGGSPQKVVFSGVGKTLQEMNAALSHQIKCFNVESSTELSLINQLAEHLNVQAPVALRINPDVNALSHPYISTGLKENKFGIPIEEALALYQTAHALPHIQIKGIACHIGSQITQLDPFLEALTHILELQAQLKTQGIFLEHIDIGGGLGVRYHEEMPPSIEEYAQGILAKINDSSLTVLLEPGRAITAQAGILVTQILLLKQSSNKHFCIVDAGMNDFIRPALYEAWHNIIPLHQAVHPPRQFDVVGPICESTDFLGKDRTLCVAPGEYLAICGAGAYGFVTSSNYPTRPRPCEVMVKDKEYKIVRPREDVKALFAQEKMW